MSTTISSSKLRVAIVHDWLTVMRGAEKCLEVLCEIYPNADIYTLFYNPDGISSTIKKHKIYPSFLQKFPVWQLYFRYLYPLMPMAIEKFDLRGYDLVISSSWCAANGAVVPPETYHISYTYTPMRYAWDLYSQYFGVQSATPLWKKIIIAPYVKGLRLWDYEVSKRPDAIYTCSKYAASKIRKYYHRNASVIFPPVDVDKFSAKVAHKNYFLMVTSFEPNKNVDLAVKAFNELGLPLVIAGGYGRYFEQMQKIARSNIKFLGWISEKEKAKLLSDARAFIFPGIDEFGIAPVEAMASGVPVIALGIGGAVETVMPWSEKRGGTGVLFNQATVPDLITAIKKFVDLDRQKVWDRRKIRKHAVQFSEKAFKKNVEKAFKSDFINFLENRN